MGTLRVDRFGGVVYLIIAHSSTSTLLVFLDPPDSFGPSRSPNSLQIIIIDYACFDWRCLS